ncbi:hypothetical protein [Hymenobacter terrenus]|uniref:hypothetical protein n=1 Tax=Hymenobacter terrenus TaxID=1629124 RepID=UPI0006191DAE|nr:hypothetical protein [Hymenobacter terrenus]
MKLTLLLLLALLFETSVADPAPGRVTSSPLMKTAYMEAKKACRAAQPQRTFPLKKANGRITIPTTKGPKVFKDVIVDEVALQKGIGEEETLIHDYLGFLPEFHCHLLKLSYYETSEYLMIDEAGRQITLCGEPIFSPDMRYIVASSQGIEYGGGQANVIELLELQKSGLRQIWKLEPKTWEPYRVCWASATALLLSKVMWTGKNPGSTYTYARLVVH